MLNRMVNIFLADWLNISIIAFIMVSALIVFLGFLKPFTFDKIKNKYVRKTSLYFSSIVLSFALTAVTFWVKDWNFVYYWIASGGFAVYTVFVYSLYEGTNLKPLVHFVGGKVWDRITGIKISGNKDELKQELNTILDDLTKSTKNTLGVEKKTIKHDKELDNA